MRIGIDLGGTKIEGCVLGLEGEILARRRRATPRGNYEETLDVIVEMVRDLEDSQARSSVGVGIPGAISPSSGLVKNANSTWLIGRRFDRDLSKKLDRPVRVENDANCFALSEAVDGAGAGAHTVFGVILGTGVGGALVIEGRLHRGRHAIAGEWGHNPLPWPKSDEQPGAPCYCGQLGCIETFLSGAGLSRTATVMGCKTLEPQELALSAASGETAAHDALERYLDRLARALASVINIVDPEAIVLGGGLSNIAAIYEELPNRLPKYVFSDRCETPVLRAKHGDSSGVRGAAWLWPLPGGTRTAGVAEA